MWQEERGSVTAFSLVVIASLLTVVGGVSSLTINEMRTVESEVEETQAAYAAEAGIEQVMYDLTQDNLDSSSEWTKEDGKYKFSAQKVFNDERVSYSVTVEKLTGKNHMYEVVASGSMGAMNKKIVTHIKYNNIMTEPVTSGNNLDAEGSALFGLWNFSVDIYDQDGNKIDPDDRAKRPDEELPDFNFNAQEHKDKLSDKYFADQAAFESSEYYSSSGQGSWFFGDIFKDEEVNLPPGKMLYVDGNLSMAYDRITSSDPKNPAVVVVNGDLNFGDLYNNIENVYFIVNGDYNMVGAGLDTKNTLIYTTGNIDLTNDIDYDYKGALISAGDMDLIGDNLLGGISSFASEIRAEPIQTDVFSHSLNTQTGLSPVMISWEEK